MVFWGVRPLETNRIRVGVVDAGGSIDVVVDGA